MARLTLIHEGTQMGTWKLGWDDLHIGRSPELDITIDDERVSRDHARVFLTASGYVLEDRSSDNGLWLEGKRIERRVLRHGDEIGIAGFLLLYDAEGFRPAFTEADPQEASIAVDDNLLAADWDGDATVAMDSSLLVAEDLSARAAATPRILIDGEELPLRPGTNRVGWTQGSCDVLLPGRRRVRGAVLALRRQGGRVMLEHLEPKVRVMVNGIEARRAELRDGDTVTVADTGFSMILPA